MTVEHDINTGNITGAAYEALVGICQCNGWLRRGGIAWKEDPFLEEYSYSFKFVDDIDELRFAFASGNWAIRQGFVLDDLAFIQQVDGGDEWWVLKLTGNGTQSSDWHSFESMSFKELARSDSEEDQIRFNNLIRGMQMASVDECILLFYEIRDASPAWDCCPFSGSGGKADPSKRLFTAATDKYILRVIDDPNDMGVVSQIYRKEPYEFIEDGLICGSALSGANVLLRDAARWEKSGEPDCKEYLTEKCARLAEQTRLAKQRDKDNGPDLHELA